MKLFVSIILILFSCNSYSQDVIIAKRIEAEMLFYNGKQTFGIGGVSSPFFSYNFNNHTRISPSIFAALYKEFGANIYDYCKGRVALSFIHKKTALALCIQLAIIVINIKSF